MNAALWAIAVAIILVGITLGLVGLVLTQIAKSAQAMASQVGLRREAQDQRIDDLQNMLFAHCELKHHVGTKRKEVTHGTPKELRQRPRDCPTGACRSTLSWYRSSPVGGLDSASSSGSSGAIPRSLS